MMMTGVVGSIPLMPFSNWMPSILGIWISVMTTSTAELSTTFRAWAPEFTVVTS